MQGAEVAVIGAGNIGIAVAYYLVKDQRIKDVVLIDPRDPMSLTSAQSGENYRNWWPHPTMTAFTDHSISLLEEVDRASGGRINMTRGGYALVTRNERPQAMIDELHVGYRDTPGKIRIHESLSDGYAPPVRAPWSDAPAGVDVLLNRDLIRKTFPSLGDDVASVVHVRRAGSISGQQLGQYMLEEIRAAGGRLVRAEVRAISGQGPFTLELEAKDGTRKLCAGRIVNAAGPFVQEIGAMLGEEVAVKHIFQQKISFQDREGAISRNLPFTIDMDAQILTWTDEDRELLASDPETRRLVEPMPGAIHVRPDGAVDGNWIKMGWAYNARPTNPRDEDPIDPQFPDTVLRGASRLHSKLTAYIGRLPRGTHHYGGYYTMTEENWPLIGRMKTDGAFIAGALSGFGSMAACASGALCAAWVAGKEVPGYARTLAPQRYQDDALMKELRTVGHGTL